MTSSELDAMEQVIKEARQQSMDPADWRITDIDKLLTQIDGLVALARKALAAERKLHILYDIGVSDADNAEMLRRFNDPTHKTDDERDGTGTEDARDG